MYPLILISIVFAPLAFAAVEPGAYVPLYAAFFLGAAAIYAKGEHTHAVPIYKNLLPAVLAVALIGLLQTVNQSPVNGPAHLLFTTWRLSTLNAVITWLFYAAVMYAAAKTIKTPSQLSRLLWVVFGMGVFIALMGTLQKSGDNHLIYGLRLVRGDSFGPFVNRDHGAMFLSMAGMCGLGLFFGGFKPLFRHQSHTKMFDLLAVQFLKLVMIVAIVAGIVKTGSRGGLHSFVSAAVFMGFVASGFLKKRAHKIAAWLALILLLAGYGLILNKYKILLGLQDDKLVSSVTVRFSMYKSGWEMLKDFPVFGAGLGAVEHGFPLYAREDLTSVTKNVVRNVHSDWLQLFLQAGWLGGLIYLAGLFGALYVFYRGWLRCRSFTVKAVYGGALGGALASKPAVEGRGLTPHEEEDQPEPVAPPKKYANAAAVIAALLALAAVPQFVAWQYGQRAKDAEFEDKIKLRAAALRWQATPINAFRLGADYYNHALKYKVEPCAKFSAANAVMGPYLRQAPLNADLNKLAGNLRLQLANCYNRELVLKGGGKPVPSGQPPSGLSRP